MKHSVEKQIKSAFESWDNQTQTIGFDKNGLWNSMQESKSTSSSPWFKVAAIAIIILLSGALSYNIYEGNALKEKHQLLLSDIENLKNSINSEPIVKKEVEIQYKTQVKEVVSTEMKKRLAQLKKNYSNLLTENKNLQENIKHYAHRNYILCDSLLNLQKDHEYLEQVYAQQMEYLKEQEKSGFSIDINEEALMALSKTVKPIKKQNNNKLKVRIKKNRNVTESSAPIFKGIQ
jgi:hypothetical protein